MAVRDKLSKVVDKFRKTAVVEPEAAKRMAKVAEAAKKMSQEIESKKE